MLKRVMIRVLGATSATVDDTSVAIGSERQRRLLAALAIDAGAAVPAERLADRVWADGELPDDPRRALRTNLARLRSQLGADVIETTPGGWRLSGEAVVDADRFKDLVAGASQAGTSSQEALSLFDDALALWGGDAYEEVATEHWAAAEAALLDELRLSAVEQRYEAMLDAGLHADALPGLGADADSHPFRDRLMTLRMLALYRSGRQAEATRAFDEHRERLVDMGLEPSVELVELDRQIVSRDPSLELGTPAGTALRSYRLGDQLGEGAFAVVYRGTQPSLGREVAVKVIRSELANRPEFVRRFEVEASVVGNLEHPYIVPLYDYWREPDRACLVMRYLRGGTLESRLTSDGPLSVGECATMVEQIGAALATAHAAGVVHRDVKPANVFLDEEGNFYLGDFGIAVTAPERNDPAAVLSAGSPAYASPEQLRREPVGPPADVHGLGVSMYEALTARLPFPDATGQASLLHHQLHDPIPHVRERRTDLPEQVDLVIQRATAKNPDGRYQTVEELMAEFREALDATPTVSTRPGTATVVPATRDRNPYKGLRSFGEADAGDFRGRERLVDRLVEMLSRTGTPGRIAAVVGPSGIGKSSVVRAGLLPRLRRGAVPGSDAWFVATMMPGNDPFDELGAALLRVATSVPDNMIGQLGMDTRGIATVVKALMPEDGDAELLLVIDQFEELFTLSSQPATARFLQALEHAVTDARCPLRVVLTVRADFWDRPLRYGAFARLIEQSTVNVTALAPDELESAIVEPAYAAGAEFEPGLVSQLVADVADEPGALPMLQYALTELYDRRVSDLLIRDAYDAIGGITGALASRAEELYLEATADERTACRRLFGRLVTPGDGTEDTRRRAQIAEVASTEAAESVIDHFGTARLLSFDHDPATREPTVEVAHEALIREWPRLRQWLDEDRDRLRSHRRLTAAAAAWRAAGDDPSELYRGGRLESVEALLEEGGLTDDEAAFLQASIDQRTYEAATEVRRVRRLRRLALGTAIVAVLALVAGGLALTQWSRAEDKADEAATNAVEAEEARDEAIAQAVAAQEAKEEAQAANRQADYDRLRSSALSEVDRNPALGLLLAVEAQRLDPSLASASALHRVLTASDGLEATMEGTYGLLDLVDNGTSAVAVRPDGIDVWDLTTRSLLRTADREVRFGTQVSISSTAGLIAASDLNGTDLISIDSGSVIYSDERELDRLSFSTAGGELAAFNNGSMEIWDVSDPTDPRVVDTVDGGYANIAWHPDGRSYALVRNDGQVQYWDRASAGPRWVFDGPAGRGGPSLFSSDGETLVMGLGGAGENSVIAFSVADGSVAGGPMTHSNGILDLLWMDETALRVAVAINSADLEAWDLRQMVDIDPPIAADTPWALEYSTDLDRIVEVGALGLRLWRPRGASPLERVIPLTPAQLASNPDPPVFATLSRDGSQLLTAAFAFTSPFPATVAHDLTTSPASWRELDTDGLVTGDNGYTLLVDREMVVLDEDLEPVGVPVPTPPDLQFFVPSPDGRFFAVYRMSGVLELYSSSSGLIAELVIPGAENHETAIGFSFSGDGSKIAAEVIGENEEWAIFDTTTGEVIMDGDPETLIRPFLAGKTLYAEDPQGAEFTILRLDPDTLEPVGNGLQGHVSARVMISDDGVSPLIASSSFDGTVRVWDRATGQQVGRELDYGAAATQLVADGTALMVIGSGGVSVWNYDIDSWADIACEVAGRNLTEEEWDEFGPRTIDRRETCPT